METLESSSNPVTTFAISRQSFFCLEKINKRRGARGVIYRIKSIKYISTKKEKTQRYINIVKLSNPATNLRRTTTLILPKESVHQTPPINNKTTKRISLWISLTTSRLAKVAFMAMKPADGSL